MSDNEIEDVSFLPGESLHRRAMYEPNILQKLRIVACNKGRAAVIATIGCLFLLIIALIVALSTGKGCDKFDSSDSTPDSDETPSKQDYISTNGKPFPYKDIRLPSSVIPYHYQLALHPNISKSFFSGNVKIFCDVKENSDFIVFHAKTLNITKMDLNIINSDDQVKIIDWLEYITNEQIYLKLGASLQSGSKVVLNIDFQGDLTKKLAGFYKSSYKTNTGEERHIVTTHFEPTDARAAFPCFDEPQLKATFDLTMIREKGQTSLFNMPLVKTEDYEGGLVRDVFDKTVKMSTYLVAFVVCDYKSITKSTKRNIKVSVYAAEDSIHAAQFALDTAVNVIDYYEEFFRVQYPLPKQDLIAIPDFAAGAMENWGLITYRETAVLYDPKVSSAKNKQRVAVVVAHELAHQWFGNLVTMEWWDDLWLNEGFASYVEYIGSGIGHEDWKMEDQFVSDALLRALYLDSLENSHPISIHVENPNQINEIFDTITYDKGASIIRMLSKFLGDNVFQDGLTSYLKQYKFGNAATNNLWDSLSESVANSDTKIGTDVKSLMRTWTEQMGYPVVMVTRQKGNHKALIKQDRFLLYKKEHTEDKKEKYPSPFGYKWELPFTYSVTSNPGKVNKYLLKDKSASIDVPENVPWIKGNCGLYGYYRVNYDNDNWKQLIQQLHLNHSVFSIPERAGLIDDAFMLARAGLLDYSTALDLSLYMVNEEEYIPWQTLIDNWAFLESRLEDKSIFKKFKKYQMKLIKNQVDKMEWKDSGTVLEKYLRSAILGMAVDLDHTETIAKGIQLFKNWTLEKKEISPDLKSLVYKTGIMYGDEDDWEDVLAAFVKERDASEKIKLLKALSQTKKTILLERFLKESLNDTLVRSQDAFRVPIDVSATNAGQVLAWRFLKQNWQIYYDRYSSTAFIMSALLKGVCSKFDTDFDHDEIKTFFSTRDPGSGQLAVSQVLEKIQANINWRENYEKHVIEWLEMSN